VPVADTVRAHMCSGYVAGATGSPGITAEANWWKLSGGAAWVSQRWKLKALNTCIHTLRVTLTASTRPWGSWTWRSTMPCWSRSRPEAKVAQAVSSAPAGPRWAQKNSRSLPDAAPGDDTTTVPADGRA
jgi:hypothetical protein